MPFHIRVRNTDFWAFNFTDLAVRLTRYCCTNGEDAISINNRTGRIVAGPFDMIGRAVIWVEDDIFPTRSSSPVRDDLPRGGPFYNLEHDGRTSITHSDPWWTHEEIPTCNGGASGWIDALHLSWPSATPVDRHRPDATPSPASISNLNTKDDPR